MSTLPIRTAGYLLALSLLSCGGEDEASTDSITLYTCISDTTVQPMLEEFEQANPDSEVELFRAPTGELNARVAGDVRSGGLRADVIWGCDPLTVQAYVDQDLVGGWIPDNASAVPEEFRTADYVGAQVLYMVAVHRDGVDAPQTWADLTDPELAGATAVPDPTFAASALGTLGYFADADGYGLDFYADLEGNGAVQVSSPTDVTVGVAQGVYEAGMTIANEAYLAEEDGSPINVTWPEPGGIAIHGPIALARHSADSAVAQDFLTYVVSEQGQQTLADAGSYSTLPGVSGPTIPPDAPIVLPDWPAIAEDTDELLSSYQEIFAG